MQVVNFYIRIKTLILLALVSFPVMVIAEEDAATHAVVFMYHRFGEQNYPSTNVRVEQFIQQLNYLERNQFKVWPLTKIVSYLRQRRPLPDKTIAITVDDAYLSVFQIAFPILKQRGIPFTLFVSTDPLDKKFSSYMSWEELRMLKDSGVTIGNHSATHDHLIKSENETEAQWRHRVRSNIETANQRFKQELNIEPRLFAYPYGEYSMPLAEMMDEMGFVSFGQQSGAIGFDSDHRAYARYPIAEAFSDTKEFAAKALSYPLDISEISPTDPVIADGDIPALKGKLSSNLKRAKELQCYASGQGKIAVRWRGNDNRRFEVVASKPFRSRRFRYNCTVPSEDVSRYYWFSHLWIQPGLAEE